MNHSLYIARSSSLHELCSDVIHTLLDILLKDKLLKANLEMSVP